MITYFWKQEFPVSLFSFAKEKTFEDINFSLKAVTSVNKFMYILPVSLFMYIFSSKWRPYRI